MKILHITSLGFEHGGVETGIILQKGIMERMGHTVKVFSSNFNSSIPHFSDYEFDAIEYQPNFLKIFYRMFYPKSFFALKKVLGDFKPDVVHIHTISQISPSILFLLKKYPTILTVHQTEDFTSGILLWSFPSSYFKDGSYNKKSLTVTGWLHYFYHRYINGKIYKIGLKNVDHVVGISRYIQEELKKDGLDSVYIPNTARMFDYCDIKNTKTIVFVGRVERVKGIQDLVSAMPKILNTFPDSKLLIVGRGSYKEEIEKLIMKLGVGGSVNFLGFQDSSGLEKVYRDSTVVVMPSIWPESFGNVGIEAMSVGRPVVASNTGGAGDWLTDGQTGYMVPTSSPDDIADRVIKLFSSDELLKEMSKKAREQALNFSSEKYIKRITDLYNETLKKYNK